MTEEWIPGTLWMREVTTPEGGRRAVGPFQLVGIAHHVTTGQDLVVLLDGREGDACMTKMRAMPFAAFEKQYTKITPDAEEPQHDDQQDPAQELPEPQESGPPA